MPPASLAKNPMTGRVEDLLLAEEAERPSRGAEHRADHRGVEVAAVVEDDDHRSALRDPVHAVDVEAHVGEQLRPLQRAGPVLQLAPGDLEHALGQVEVAQWPSLQSGQRDESNVGVDGDGVADGIEERGVVVAVAVGVRGAQVDACLGGPVADGLELAPSPDERSVHLTGVRAVLGRPPRGDHGVEPEPLGERRDERFRARGRHHQHPTCLTVLLDHTRGVRLNLLLELLGGRLRGISHQRLRPSSGGPGGQPRRLRRQCCLPEGAVGRREERRAGQ